MLWQHDLFSDLGCAPSRALRVKVPPHPRSGRTRRPRAAAHAEAGCPSRDGIRRACVEPPGRNRGGSHGEPVGHERADPSPQPFRGNDVARHAERDDLATGHTPTLPLRRRPSPAPERLGRLNRRWMRWGSFGISRSSGPVSSGRRIPATIFRVLSSSATYSSILPHDRPPFACGSVPTRNNP